MLNRENGLIQPYPIRVKYTDVNSNELIEQWALPNKDWWVQFAETWKINDMEFIDLTDTMSDEQKDRLQLVLDNSNIIIAQYDTSCINFITNGEPILNPRHPLAYLSMVNIVNNQRKQITKLIELTNGLVDKITK